MQKTFVFLFLILTHNAFTKVTPPNYNFSLKQLSIFFPGEKLAIVSKSYKNPILLSDIGEDILYQKYKIIHPNYTFHIYVQSKSGIILDFFAKLPSYFAHNLFHQSIIDKFGKQNSFSNKDSTSIYKWKLKNNIELIYSGACTITCFTIYITAKSTDKKIEFTPMLDKLVESEPSSL